MSLNPKKAQKSVYSIRKLVEAGAGDVGFDGRDDDMIILVMGPTGAGKSTFINNVSEAYGGKGDVTRVGHSLQSCSTEIQPIVLGYHGKRLVMVDTPGFDDTYRGDPEILKDICIWLGKMYKKDKKFSGIIYLHDITQSRMLGTSLKSLSVFRKLCGEENFQSITLGTTKWGGLQELDVGIEREKELRACFWKEMVDRGSLVCRIGNEALSVKKTVEDMLGKSPSGLALQIQKELMELEKFIPDTAAGQELLFTLNEILHTQRSGVRIEEVRAAIAGLKKMKVPMTKRFLSFFGV